MMWDGLSSPSGARTGWRTHPTLVLACHQQQTGTERDPRPEATKRRHGGDDRPGLLHDARDLARGAGVVVEMLEGLAGGDRAERAVAEGEAGHVAHDDGGA